MEVSKDIVYGRYIGTEKPGETRVLRHIKIAESEVQKKHPYLGCTTILQAFENSANKHASKNFLGTRTQNSDGTFGAYEWKTYEQIKTASQNLAKGIINLNLTHITKGDGDLKFMGIFSKNREEWLLTDIACMYAGITTVPFYDTFDDFSIEFAINQTELQTVACAGYHVKTLTRIKKASPGLKALTHVISFDNVSVDDRLNANAVGIKVLDFEEVIKAGAEKNVHFPILNEDSVYTFCYTSGSTGVPKAAILDHGNFIASVSAIKYHDIDVSENDVYLSYLPLAHVFERLMLVSGYMHGISIGFNQGDVAKIVQDFMALKPTNAIVVPRILNKFYEVIQGGFQALEEPKRSFIHAFMDEKLKNLHEKCQYTHPKDNEILAPIKAMLGGRLNWMITGSAPISAKVLDYLKVAFCIPILEGFGQTESTAASTLCSISDPFSGHVGGPICSNDIKLVDVPEMNYTSKDTINGTPTPRGEICLKGGNVFRGYYKAPEKNEEAIDKDGWLHTGDIGAILPNGSLQIIDRKKNIFKLAQGEYIAPEKVENILRKSTFVSQLFVHGDSLQNYLVTVMVPELAVIKKWGEVLGYQQTIPELLKSEELKKAIIDDFHAIGRKENLHGYELPHRVHLTDEPFSIENGLLTPTLKLKRHEAKLKYAKEIAEMYSNTLISKL